MNAITVEISKMTLAPGDVVVLRTPHILPDDQMKRMRTVFEGALPDGVKVVVLFKDFELEVFTAAGVRK